MIPKDQFTLKSNNTWKFSFDITRINYILKCIKIENNYFKL